jgi:GH25 family lysozyme M1 (1,4-beta-N-acetylmuramidase)
MPKIKGDYFAVDVAYYEPVGDGYEGDWKSAIPRPDYVIARASYGTANDSWFLNHWKQLKELGIRRGAYHYFYAVPYSNRFTPQEHAGNQAQAFIKQLRAGNFDPKYDTLWLDWETQAVA